MRKRSMATVVMLIVLIAVFCMALTGCGESPTETIIEDVQQPASTAATEANLRTIDQAIQVYYATEGEYPSTINDLVPKYLKELPADPGGGTYYIVVQGDEAKAAVK
ncbi:MAG: hypothetical protein JW738_04085 [Actinobacteria bacterium]|nr:hypothetical protein [Actinomycetota bacterium]